MKNVVKFVVIINMWLKFISKSKDIFSEYNVENKNLKSVINVLNCVLK